jgi:pimeloyl-ACP methyl ester carboxylesterase
MDRMRRRAGALVNDCVPFMFVLALVMTPAPALARLDTETPRRLENGARLDWVPCAFEPQFGEDAHCASFHPAAVPGAQLPVVVLKSSLPDTRDSPVLYLPPGPASAVGLTAQGLAQWWHWMGLARWPHDLVLFDVPGAGESQPRLDCPEVRDADRAHLGRPLTAEDDLRLLQDALARCHKRLRASGIDPRAYATDRQVQAVGELMALLGGNDWNLWGVSYGTRLALHAVREFPGRVRSVILDSAYPPEVNGLLAKPWQFAQVATALGRACENDAACARAHPRAARDIEALLRRLAAEPVPLEVEKWPAQWRHTLAVNDYRLLWMLFLETYRPAWRPRFAHAVARALDGDFAPLLPLAENFVESLLDRDFSHGLYYATTCPEDLPGVSREAYLAEARRYPAVARHFLAEWDLHPCRAWGATPLPEAWYRPVESRVPALFLSGAHDTVTPPAWAARAARGFARGRHRVFAGSSHAVTWENDCAMGVAWEFLADPALPAVPACWREARHRP